MCKILIAEPNKDIVDEMIDVLEQRYQGIELILHADDYKNALNLCTIHHPDLILLNVDNDSEDCFSVIERMHIISSGGIIILLIDEDNTFYLKKILRKRNERFVLKPLDKDNFFNIVHSCIREIETTKGDTKVINNLVEKVQQLKPQVEHNLIQNLILNTPREVLLHGFEILDYHFCEGVIAIMPGNIKRSILINAICDFEECNGHVICSDYYNYYVLLIVAEEAFQLAEICKMQCIIKDINAEKFVIGMGNIKRDVTLLHKSYYEAFDDLMSFYEMSSPNQFLHTTQEQMHNYTQHVFLYFMMINEYYVKACIRDLASSFSVYDINTREKVLFSFNQGLREMLSYAFKTNEDEMENEYQIEYLADVDDLDNMYEKLLHIYTEATDPVQSMRYDIPHTQLRKVLYFIHNHHTDKQISLQSISTSLQISTYYICKLFKNYTESSFIEFLNDCRIDHAKILLKTNKKINDIAYEVGYQSTTYFGRVFKNIMGMTPKDYRINNNVFTFNEAGSENVMI